MSGSDRKTHNKQVLVIGAGVAGAAAANRLAEAGCRVHLIDKAAAIGGRAGEMGCKATDRCLHCNVCVAGDMLSSLSAQANISIHTQTRLAQAVGRDGAGFEVVLDHKPVYIDRDKCIGCGLCMQICPANCISIPNPAVSPPVPVLDSANCLRTKGRDCRKCEQSCPVGAIDLNQTASQSTLQVNNILVATGYQPFDPTENSSFGFGRSANIITGVEAERQLSKQQTITRPSDGQRPTRVGFIQCVGSRSEKVFSEPEDTNYCSTVCCAYALRMARLMKYQADSTDVTIFYMDIQNFGKDFAQFYEECKGRMRFIRSRPYEVSAAADGRVRVKYSPESELSDKGTCAGDEEFDLVILATGIRPGADNRPLADLLNLPVDEAGFFGLKGASAFPELQQQGIYVVGTAQAPMDIAGCISDAEAVSTKILSEA